MKPVYERAYLTISEFDHKDAIATSGVEPTEAPSFMKMEHENAYGSFGGFDLKNAPGSWF